MQKFQQAILVLLVSGCITFYSCGPNDDSGGMDQKNSDGEGEVDSTRLTNFDTSSASVSVPYYIQPRTASPENTVQSVPVINKGRKS